MYVISTSICSVSQLFWQLASARMFQGFGDAACTTVSFAILRDCYNGKKLTKAMALVGMVMMFAPIIAPLIGAYIISVLGEWQWIFHFLTAYGVFLFFCSFFVPETNYNRFKFQDIYTNYKLHFANKRFMILSLATSLSFAALFSFIGSSAIIYMSIYHVSKFDYALLFGLNATAILVANFTLKRMLDKFDLFKIQIFSITLAVSVLLVTVIMISIFESNLILFIILMWFVTFFLAISSNSMMSEAMLSIKNAFGIATSISTFIKFALAGLANFAMTLFAYNHLNQIMLIQQFISVLIIASLYAYSRKLSQNA